MAARFVLSSALRLWAALSLWAVLAFATACGPPPFVVHVVYPGKVEVERGSPVVYEGVQIGEVESVVLRQGDPTQRARVDVTLEIDDPSVVLRDGDQFHLSHLRGVPIVEVSPTFDESQPIASGARVVGVPPLVTQIEETFDAAIESIGNLAVEAIEKAFEDLELEYVPPEHSAPARPDADPLR